MKDTIKDTDRLYTCFTKLLHCFQSNKLPLVLLRPKKIGKPECFEGDYDFLYRKGSLLKILSVIHANCKDEGVHFEVNQKAMSKCLITLFVEENSNTIVMEFWPHIELKSGKNKFLDQISSETMFSSSLMEENRHCLLCLVYITHLYHKEKDIFTEENVWRFNEYRCSLEEKREKNEEISCQCIELLNKLQEGHISLNEANKSALRLLKDRGIRNEMKSVVYIQTFLKRVLRKLKFSTKQIIPMIGPDGSGKGTIQEKAIAGGIKNFELVRFKELFRVFPFYNIRYRFFRDFKNTPANERDESMLHFIFWVSLFSFLFFLIRERSKHIVMDRYFTDYFASPVRYLTNTKKIDRIKFYRIYLCLTPTPKKLIVLGCKDESLTQRKNELETVAVRELEWLTYDFICKKKVQSVLFLSTERPPEETALILNSFLES